MAFGDGQPLNIIGTCRGLVWKHDGNTCLVHIETKGGSSVAFRIKGISSPALGEHVTVEGGLMAWPGHVADLVKEVCKRNT